MIEISDNWSFRKNSMYSNYVCTNISSSPESLEVSPFKDTFCTIGVVDTAGFVELPTDSYVSVVCKCRPESKSLPSTGS